MVEPTDSNKILSITFNQDQGCFAVGTEKGFKIFNSYPFKDTFQRDFDAGIGMVTMLFRSNILALVGGGSKPKYPPNKVILWDDHQMKCIGELSFKSNVRSVRLRKDKVVVALDQRIYVYQISDLKLLEAIDTFSNPEGLCAVSSKEGTILVCPDKKKGSIRITNFDTNKSVEEKAHEGGLVAIALTQDGRMCATASEKGTLIRVFNTADGKLLQELRRGADKADIKSIAFDQNNNWLACSSDKGTIHIFSLGEAKKIAYPEMAAAEAEPGKKEAKNPTSALKFMKGLFSYFGSERSFAQLRLSDSDSVVAFGPEEKNYIIVVTKEGKYYLAQFDPKAGGECAKVQEKMLFSS